MKIIFSLLLLFFNYLPALCQSFSEENKKDILEGFIVKGDSLKKIDRVEALSVFKTGLAIALDNELYVQSAIFYKKIGALYHREQQFIEAEKMYRAGIALDKTSKTFADLHYNMSLVKERLNQKDSALFYLEKSLKFYEDFKIENSGYKAFLRASAVYMDRQDYEKALKYSIKAYEGFKKNDNLLKLTNACTAIGNIQSQMRNHHQALDYHHQALQLEKKLKDSLGIGISYNNIANVYDDLKVHDSALVNYKKAIHYLKNNKKQYAVLLSNIAMTYNSIGEKQLAEKNFKISIETNHSLKDSTSLLYNYNGITSLYLDDDNLTNAREYLDKSNKLMPVITDKKAVLSLYENESEYYNKRKQYKTALEYQIKYADLYKDIYNTEQVEKVQTLQARFDKQRNENKILSLNLANKNAELELSEKNKSIHYKNLSLVILAIVILLGIVAYLYLLQKQKSTNQTAKIGRMEAIYNGQEIIKKRIARDLHDIITTNFDGLRLRVLALKHKSNLNKSVDGITDDLKKMNQQIRMVSHRLYPLEMYMGKQKFTDIITSRLSEFQLYGNVFVELEEQLPEILNNLPIAAQNNLYGILLEVLNNVEKHAHATKLSIKNYLDNKGHLNIVFEDNGIGITNKHKEGIGLMNIKQRIELMEGSCVIQKTKIGTKVQLEFPIKK